jgi:hypothetical protein
MTPNMTDISEVASNHITLQLPHDTNGVYIFPGAPTVLPRLSLFGLARSDRMPMNSPGLAS